MLRSVIVDIAEGRRAIALVRKATPAAANLVGGPGVARVSDAVRDARLRNARFS